jgi:hypothetical protein
VKSNTQFELNWFFGVVEARNDPLEMGRLRVRVYGAHTADKVKDQFKGIPTEELLWAQTINSVQSASVSGVGISPNGPVEGSMVFGFFLDGHLCQLPYILGTIDGIPVAAPDKTQGFNDPKGVYPKFLNEPDLNRLARSAFRTHRGLASKIAARITGIPTAVNSVATTGVLGSTDALGPKWDEPAAANNTRYPYNHVRETESGHVEEFDDSPGAERMHWMHGTTGTYEEWQPDGSVSQKITEDQTIIVVGGRNILVGKDQTITILGNAKILVQGDVQEQVNGDVTRLIKGSLSEKIEGNYTRDILGESFVNTQGNVVQRDGSNRTEVVALNKTESIGMNNSLQIGAKNSIQCLGDWTQTAATNFTHITGGNKTDMVGGSYSINVSSAYGLACATFSVGVSGAATIDATGPTAILGSRIDLN